MQDDRKHTRPDRKEITFKMEPGHLTMYIDKDMGWTARGSGFDSWQGHRIS
jgi:hypothetical protein